MCGIIGYIGKDNAVDVVVEGLRHLEYRGYDSAGIAFLSGDTFAVRRCMGKIKELDALILKEKPVSGIAIGHTRWATHGVPSENNSHPHSSESIILVHNGIIENHLELKEELIGEGYSFTSETDTEVIAHLIDRAHRNHGFEDAVRLALRDVRGAYALVILSSKERNRIIGVRKDSPLVVGLGGDEFFLASDIPAFMLRTRDVIFLDDGEMAVIDCNGCKISGLDGEVHEKKKSHVTWSPSMADKGGYKHYMLKEIHEQPRALADTLRGRVFVERAGVNPDEFGIDPERLKDVGRVIIGACGTSLHAAIAGKFMIEQLARVPTEVDYASEFRYRDPIVDDGSIFIAITQSGETADTLAAQREAGRRGALTLSICNVLGSTSTREADAVFYTRSGPEIGVASTKAFTSQLISLYLFSLLLAEKKAALTGDERAGLLADLLRVPDQIEEILRGEEEIKGVAKEFFKVTDFLYLGRGILYPIALEGALKLKEISYIHAEGYPAGEMKHGPIALIDEEIPVVFLRQEGKLGEKVFSNISEVKARNGRVIAVTAEDRELQDHEVDCLIKVPRNNRYLETVLMVVPLQLLAYHIGILRGCDVDQPRNLAKSVTVE